jgi:hypothetical protein
MGRRKRRGPVWLPVLITWIVLTFFTGGGLMYLRATNRVSDGVFAPYARVLCENGARIETSYGASAVYTGTSPRRRFIGDAFLMETAECVGASGTRRALSRFDLVMLLPFAVGWGVLLAWSARRRNR